MSHLGNFKNVRISRFYTKIYTQDRRSGRGGGDTRLQTASPDGPEAQAGLRAD